MIMSSWREWRDKPPEERQADLGRYKAVRQAAEVAARRLRDECPTTELLNDAVIDAEKHVPWWRR
jgi:hypothetical protein